MSDPIAMTMLQVLELFRREYAEVPKLQDKLIVTALEIFFLIANRPSGISIGQIAERLGLAQSVASRNVSVLSASHYQGQAGMDLVAMTRDPNDQRRTLCTLSRRGENLMGRIRELLNAE